MHLSANALVLGVAKELDLQLVGLLNNNTIVYQDKNYKITKFISVQLRDIDFV